MLLSIGKPMMDVVVLVDKVFLEKYKLQPNQAKQASENESGLFKDILKLKPTFIPGGSVTNTLRVYQWMCRGHGEVFYIGIIGKDHFGDLIKTQLAKENIKFHFFEHNSETVQCAVLVSHDNKNRTLITNSLLIPGGIYKEDINIIEHLEDQILNCDTFYVPTFSLGTFANQVKEIINYFQNNKKKIIINLGAKYILEKYPKDSIYLFEVGHVIIGNEDEYRIFGKISNILNSDSLELESLIHQLCVHNKNEIKKVLIVTRGSDHISVYENKKFTYYKVEAVKNLVDTTGAGDAFAGGFLAQFVEGKSLETCIYSGIACAREIIQIYGCNIDLKKSISF